MKSFLLFVTSLLFLLNSSFSQGVQRDTTSTDPQVKYAIDLYHQYIGGNSRIYNGREYLPFNFYSEGNPFLEPDTLTEGWVKYDGRLYQHLHMLYDIVRNQVVILNYDRQSYIELQNLWIDSFGLLNHTFIRLQKNDQQHLYVPGFYDLLYNGHLQILARRTKAYLESIKDNRVLRTFYQHNYFFIHEGDQYYPVNNKREVYRLFADKKHAIRKFLRQHKSKLRRKNFEKAMILATTYYDQLTH